MNVSVEQKTLSPALTSSNLNARWIAAVPELTARAPLDPTYSDIFSSNRSTLGPNGAIQLESKDISIYFCSLPVMWGDERKILFLLLLMNSHPFLEEIFT